VLEEAGLCSRVDERRTIRAVRWRKVDGGGHVEDMRGRRTGPTLAVGGGIGGLLVLLLTLFLGGGGGGGGGGTGIDIRDVINQFPGAPAAPEGQQGPPGAPDPDAQLFEFVEFLSVDIQDLWQKAFAESGRTYRFTEVNVFTASVQTGCGGATSAVGPFYCPADGEVYIDLDFYRELASRFAAPGDFAQAYVLAHEVGHHVQKLLGISDEVHRAQQSESGEDANALSVRLELQADCMAGVWAHSVRSDLESGDIDEGLTAAAAVGDDRIQAQAGVDVDPETWTHGSAEQRTRWFTRGYESGNVDDCDTFAADDV
jgi:predicted metalloprotease